MMDSGVYFAEGTMFFISLRSSGSRPGQIPANILRRVAMFCEIQQSSSNLSKFPSPRRARKLHRDLVQSTPWTEIRSPTPSRRRGRQARRWRAAGCSTSPLGRRVSNPSRSRGVPQGLHALSRAGYFQPISLERGPRQWLAHRPLPELSRQQECRAAC